MKVKVFFAWYDMWIGVFVDRKWKFGRWGIEKELHNIYICPLPCVVIQLDFFHAKRKAE